MFCVVGELAFQLKDSGAKYVIAQAPFINTVKDAVARCPNVKVGQRTKPQSIIRKWTGFG